MMRKILAITVLIGALSLSGCEWLMFARYSSPEYGFSILLPRLWDRQEGFQNTTVIARSPLEGPQDKFQENITVIAGDLPQDAPETPLDILFEMNKEQLMQVLPGVKSDVSEGELLSGNEKGKWLAFTNQAGGISLKVTVAVWLKNKRVYTISCTGESSELSKYDPIFKIMLRSLRMH